MNGTIIWAILGVFFVLAVALTPQEGRPLPRKLKDRLRAASARLRGHDITVDYRDGRGHRGRRRIRILDIGVYGSWNIYLIAYCYAVRGARRYHFEHIERVTDAEGRVFSARDYFKELRAFGWPPMLRTPEASHPAQEPAQVVMLASAAERRRAAASLLHPASAAADSPMERKRAGQH
jgi:hypothetical protein